MIKVIENVVLAGCYLGIYFSSGSFESGNGWLFAKVNYKDS